jgi:hypothetical protein
MKLFREPLVHFLVAGILLFASYSWLNRGAEDNDSEATRVVHLTQRQISRTLDFAAMRDKVMEEWQRQHQQTANEKFFAALLQKYDVVVDEDIKSLVGPLEIEKTKGR